MKASGDAIGHGENERKGREESHDDRKMQTLAFATLLSSLFYCARFQGRD